MSDNSISIIMPVYNEEKIIKNIINGIINNISDNVKELIIIIDGCTDNSEDIIKETIEAAPENLNIILAYTDNVFEVIACNVGFKLSTCDYSLNIQADMLIQEKYFDKRMLKPFWVIPNLLAVSARDAVDTRILNGNLDYYNVAGKDVGTPRNIFSIRDAINRGPILFDNKKLKEMNYLDEYFAPQESDEVELCIRAYKEKGYLVGSYVIDYYSPPEWGKGRTNITSYLIWEQSLRKNYKMILQRHYDFIVGEKHSRDIEIP